MIYFQIVAAEVGLILVSMTAFRAVFVTRAARNQHSPRKSPSMWLKSRYFLRNTIDPRRWKYSKDITEGHEDDAMKDGIDGELPNIPGATMTGMHTFVNRQGEEVKSEIEVSTYQDTLSSRSRY